MYEHIDVVTIAVVYDDTEHTCSSGPTVPFFTIFVLCMYVYIIVSCNAVEAFQRRSTAAVVGAEILHNRQSRSSGFSVVVVVHERAGGEPLPADRPGTHVSLRLLPQPVLCRL